MTKTVQDATTQSARALQGSLQDHEAQLVEFARINSEHTRISFAMAPVEAYDLVVEVMARVEAEHGRRGFPHQSMHSLRTHLWWQLTHSQKQVRKDHSRRRTTGTRKTRTSEGKAAL
ncbi:hypothetical protein [Nocardia sp. NRRL S-836]|uniref:hypothetical protein n=1 Tax=Nocardia sp. NRRL S-836 TaxID=1519492 RepID=UPI0006AED025|nr:hypothetical protein [Nocardia sp. NRRL S-836]KOV84784.1 hypothetical protein ADL03_16095 [Nocardia sp. NRRL S-836]